MKCLVVIRLYLFVKAYRILKLSSFKLDLRSVFGYIKTGYTRSWWVLSKATCSCLSIVPERIVVQSGGKKVMGGRKGDWISTLKLPAITQSDKVSPSMQRENKIKPSVKNVQDCGSKRSSRVCESALYY